MSAAARLSLAPIPLPWPRERVLAFYEEVAGWPVDVVCLGETVCAKRSTLTAREWLDLGKRLERAGREVVFASPPGLETPGELHLMELLADGGRFAVEVNDVGLFARLRGRVPLVAGPHLQVFNAATLRTLIRWGAYRWVAPYEIDRSALAGLASGLPDCLDTEAFVAGTVPLAYSPRCFTAARLDRSRRDCDRACRNTPSGETVCSLEGERLFTQDGKQTLSGRPVSLLADLDAVLAAGASVLRVQPLAADTGLVLQATRDTIDGKLSRGEAVRVAEAAWARSGANGFWYGGAGREQVVAGLWSPRGP